MRLYSFTNTWLSGIQKGLQTAHVVNEMNRHYTGNSERLNVTSDHALHNYFEWSHSGKTIIILNGGSHDTLENYELLFSNARNLFHPWAAFREDKYSLNGAMTAVGIILPDTFNSKEKRSEILRNQAVDPVKTFDMQIAELLNNSVLA